MPPFKRHKINTLKNPSPKHDTQKPSSNKSNQSERTTTNKKVSIKLRQLYINNVAASSLDRIKMTKNWLECDQKNLTTTNLNVGT